MERWGKENGKIWRAAGYQKSEPKQIGHDATNKSSNTGEAKDVRQAEGIIFVRFTIGGKRSFRWRIST